jgi:hypothetical protein
MSENDTESRFAWEDDDIEFLDEEDPGDSDGEAPEQTLDIAALADAIVARIPPPQVTVKRGRVVKEVQHDAKGRAVRIVETEEGEE